MKTYTTTSCEIHVGRSVAPDDLRCGDFVSILSEIAEYPSFLWCHDSQLLAPNEPVRIQWRPDDGGMPLKIKAICLPYVFAKAPTGHRRILDTGNKHGSVGNWQTTLTQNQGCCGFDSHLSYSSPLRSRGAAWSARLPVTQEVVGSNPIGNAFRCPASNSMALGIGGGSDLPLANEYEKARYANRQSGQAQTLVSAGSTPACAT